MKKMTKTLAASSALAAGILMATSGDVLAGKKTHEKCYGVAKAGQNDCGIKSQGTSCAGQAKTDGIHDAWIYLPKGACDKIVGGSTTPAK